MLRFRSLGSGSAGNGTVVQCQSTGLGDGAVTRLLIDAGFTLKQLDARLAAAGLLPDQIDAVFVTHEHGDHIGCAREFALRGRVPLWMSQGTHQALGAPLLDGLIELARDGQPVALGELEIRPFTVPHDAREPLQLVCSDGARRLGVLTDLGHVTGHVLEQLAQCDALLFECNHDPELLARSDYPASLQRRIGGPLGHLSNHAAAQALGVLKHAGLGTVVAAHLSAQNNRPALARAALAAALGCQDEDVFVADQRLGTDWLPA
jgi:phosphoribosyl 1,2-cyclic phosphodiesterase